MLVGVTGKAYSGKDTFYEAVSNIQPCTRIAFADTLKNAATEIFGFDVAQLHGPLKEEIDPYWDTSARDILIRFGEGMRQLMGEDVWVKSAFRKPMPEDQAVIVTDVRFPNEADYIRERGGLIVQIVREYGPVCGYPDSPSETAMDRYAPIDLRIVNNSSRRNMLAVCQQAFRWAQNYTPVPGLGPSVWQAHEFNYEYP